MSRCIYCQEEIPEGYGIVCYSCEKKLLEDDSYIPNHKVPNAQYPTSDKHKWNHSFTVR